MASEERLGPSVELAVPSGRPVPDALLKDAVRLVLADQGVEAAEISLTVHDDDGMRALNDRYLGRDRPTDVIAFALGGPDEGPGPVVGDVYVGLDRAIEQAREHDIDLEEELGRLAIHGTLHVLGHDHPEGVERVRSEMFVLQERLVSVLMERR